MYVFINGNRRKISNVKYEKKEEIRISKEFKIKRSYIIHLNCVEVMVV